MNDQTLNNPPTPEEIGKPFLNSYWVIPDKFLAGSYPAMDDLHSIRKRFTTFLKSGINHFIDLTVVNELPEYYGILMDEATELNLEAKHQRFSIMDKGLPSKSGMTTILDAIDAALDERHKVYLHCWGGVGRTGTVVGCYLVRHGMRGREAVDHLAEIYATSGQSRFHPNSPETREQVDFILNWHESGS